MEGDGAIGRQRPRRRGPDHHARAVRRRRADLDREADPYGGRNIVVVFHLGLGERGSLHRTPHHWFRPQVDLIGLGEAVKLRDDGGFRREIHGGVSVIPVAKHAQTAELPCLFGDPASGVFTAAGAELGFRDRLLGPPGGAEFLLDLPFDRQAVAVPARNVVDVVAHREPRADHEVLQQLVERMADMDRPVGVGRAVVEHEQRRPLRLSSPTQAVIEIAPDFHYARLELGQARAHGKCCLREKHRRSIVTVRRPGVVAHDGSRVAVAKARRKIPARARSLVRRRHAGRLIRSPVRTFVMAAM